jgi:heme exporter protein C
MRTIDKTLLALAPLLALVLAVVVFAVIPNERTQGFVQKIFYVHVPCHFAAFTAFGVTAWKSFRYLATKELHHDRTAAASAEVGLLFVSLGLLSGMLWARPVWGIWWTWDLRLTTTFILWLIFLSYAILRRSVGDPERRAMLSSVVGLVAFLDVPVVYMANRVKASQHPAPVVGGGEGSGLAPGFALALSLGVATILVSYIALVRVRMRAAELEEQVELAAVEKSFQER